MSLQSLQLAFPNVAFGTSGVRALVSDLTPKVVAAYVFAFIRRMQASQSLQPGATVLVGIDLRPSSPTIAMAVCDALRSMGCVPEFLGALPTPALALHCLTTRSPGIMVTGSHIPFDRNGIKFYGPAGEILKEDEVAISGTEISLDELIGQTAVSGLPPVSTVAARAYVKRYLAYFGESALSGLKIGVYEHSAVGRELTIEILTALGATVLSLGRSDAFVPIDTEAVVDADVAQARQWCAAHALDALVSTDGDGDRPLVFDANGDFVRGDLLGLICARYLGIKALAVPVSCNTAIEHSAIFRRVGRTRIGSPFVIAGMRRLQGEGESSVAGFEANGGFLLGTALPGLAALPTRDAMLPMIALLVSALRARLSVADLIKALPERFTHSDRVKDVAPAASKALLQRVIADATFREALFPGKGSATNIDLTDGVRITFADGDVSHLRASGNAPELRCYAESSSYARAKSLCEATLGRVV